MKNINVNDIVVVEKLEDIDFPKDNSLLGRPLRVVDIGESIEVQTLDGEFEFLAKNVVKVSDYPENFKKVRGVEIADELIDMLIKEVYQMKDETVVLRTGNKTIIKAYGRVYVGTNVEVNDRVE